MAGFFYKGILLQQRKEPALSRDLREFLNADTMGLRMDCPPVENPDELTYGEIINFARMANIVDERDGEPLADKLMAARRQEARLVVVDAVDDEPYISSQLNPVLKNPQLAADGLSLCQRACGATQAYFAVYKNLTDLDIRIPKHIGDYSVVRLHGRYPAEYQASQDYHEDDSVFVVGSGAILHLARAILFNKPQTTAFITVAGDCVGNPTNLEVSLGMTVTQTLERCGLIDDPHRVVVGGSMTGISVIDTDRTLVTPTTRAILAFRQDFKTLGLSCIGCVRCVNVCPQGLNPYYLYNSVKQKRFDMFQGLDAQMCVGCGTCSYMCPAKLDLSETIYLAAREFRPQMAAMRDTAALDKQRDDADYQRFLDDYKLGKAIAAHRRVRRRLARQFYSACREAVLARRKAEKAAKAALRDAQKTRTDAEHIAEAALTSAKQQLDAVIGASDKAVAALQNTLDTVVREGNRTLRDARLLANTAEAAARQNVLAILREQQRLFDRVAQTARRKAAQKEKDASPRYVLEFRRERDSLIARAEEVRVQTCERAQECAVRAVEHARNAWNSTTQLCRARANAAAQALDAGKAEAERKKQEALRQFDEAQLACVEAKKQADAVLAQAEADAQAQRAKAAADWAEATKDLRPAALKTLQEADALLEQARETALASARASAEADAAVTARPMRPADFRPPMRLTQCEEELLRGRRLLAEDTAGEEAAVQSAAKLLLRWTREEPPTRAASVGQPGEEVLS